MQLVWVRNDIRLDDNPALFNACKTGDSIAAIYVATEQQWHLHHEASCKLGLRSQALTHMRKELASLGIPMFYVETTRYADIPSVLLDFCISHNVTQLWFNEEIPLDERHRDESVVNALRSQQIACQIQPANRIVNHRLTNQQGNYYQVFTPWYKAWLRYLSENFPSVLPPPKAVAAPLEVNEEPIVLPGSADYRHDIWPPEEHRAHAVVREFIDERMHFYPKYRDYPALHGTSTISPYLASGIISARRCFSLIHQHCVEHLEDWQSNDWLRELAWREFYYYLMECEPRLCKHRAFKPETEYLVWENSGSALQAWKDGKTGFPIIDAGMRQLNRTGWMHNRLRMLTASFLSKLLLIDWREGEKYFMQRLIDGDFPSNNGGWQWSASTGCDASPWFRIFNPYNQSEKFDPDGKFIKKLVPELADINGKDIHNPPSLLRQSAGYPEPIIDYKFARERVLDRFKNLPKERQP